MIVNKPFLFVTKKKTNYKRVHRPLTWPAWFSPNKGNARYAENGLAISRWPHTHTPEARYRRWETHLSESETFLFCFPPNADRYIVFYEHGMRKIPLLRDGGKFCVSLSRYTRAEDKFDLLKKGRVEEASLSFSFSPFFYDDISSREGEKSRGTRPRWDYGVVDTFPPLLLGGNQVCRSIDGRFTRRAAPALLSATHLYISLPTV